MTLPEGCSLLRKGDVGVRIGVVDVDVDDQYTRWRRKDACAPRGRPTRGPESRQTTERRVSTLVALARGRPPQLSLSLSDSLSRAPATPCARIDSLSATRQTCSTFSALSLSLSFSGFLEPSSFFDVSLRSRGCRWRRGRVWIHLAINDSSRVTVANHDLCVCTEQVTHRFPVHALPRGC